MDDRVTPPTPEQRLMSESCVSCGDPMEWRGQCPSCRIEEIELAIELVDQKLATLRTEREEIQKEMEANNKRTAEIMEIINALEVVAIHRAKKSAE